MKKIILFLVLAICLANTVIAIPPGGIGEDCSQGQGCEPGLVCCPLDASYPQTCQSSMDVCYQSTNGKAIPEFPTGSIGIISGILIAIAIGWIIFKNKK